MSTETLIGPNECMAMHYLAAAGWPHEELQLVFECSDDTVTRHLNRECSHGPMDAPVEPTAPVPEAIRQRRIKADLSQKELAQTINVSSSTISQWEKGEAHPRPRNVRKLNSTLPAL